MAVSALLPFALSDPNSGLGLKISFFLFLFKMILEIMAGPATDSVDDLAHFLIVKPNMPLSSSLEPWP